MTTSDDALLPLDAVRPAASAKGAVVPAPELPVAKVAVDNPLPHLDRPFDYLVPASMHESAQPGVRVRVRFAGKLVDGFLLERADESEHAGRLTPLERVVSPERVLTPEVAGLARAVADRYAGTLADVLRLAVPPRHARTETTTRAAAASAEPPKAPSGPAERSTPPDLPSVPADRVRQPPTATAALPTETPTSEPPSPEAATPGTPSPEAATPAGPTPEGRTSEAPAFPATGPETPRSEAAAADAATPEVPASAGRTSTAPASETPTPEDPQGATPGGTQQGGPPLSNASRQVGGPDLGASLQGGGSPDETVAARVGEGVPQGDGAGGVGGVQDGGRGEGAGRDLGGAWGAYPMGASFLDALRHGRAPRAVWSALPGARGWAGPVAEAVRATLDGGRGALVVVPDGKDVALLDAELGRMLGAGRHVALTADLGPAERYRRWLAVLRGQVRAVVGTRAAMFAPVERLGLVAIWDDGDDLHAERLAPYPHAREVLGLRAHRTGAAMLIGAYARTAEATQLLASRWARPIVADRQTIRSLAPHVRPAGEDAELAKDQAARAARLPSVAWRALRQGLESGPVLVQVPRRGYLPALACRHCRAPARCSHPPTRTGLPASTGSAAHAGAAAYAGAPGGFVSQGQGVLGGPGGSGTAGSSVHDAAGGATGVGEAMRLAVPGDAAYEGEGRAGAGDGLCRGPLALRGGHAAPYCRWCGRVDAAWKCEHCGSPRLRAVVVGARRTAEELGRAFPSVPVRTSGRDGVLASVPGSRALVVATPGAEPVAEGGYAAVVLLDGWALLGRADLRAGEEAVRRWMNAAALLRPRGELVVLADAGLPAVQALLRWDAVTHAERELAERVELGFPPAVRMATLTGTAAAVRQMVAEARLPADAQVLGPVPIDDSGQERAMIRVPRGSGAALAAALKGASGVRAARKTPDVVRVSVDPLDLI
ncbi:primosomal protein N' [Nonomuraea ceibae]|uniref:primosomal protein N' n=1 Tax=Nonomuraea ceibae TaxID=1935170 RepID=UPI0027E03D96|nr:primosomal protein N' [Nonomuraea ceibae]